MKMYLKLISVAPLLIFGFSALISMLLIQRLQEYFSYRYFKEEYS